MSDPQAEEGVALNVMETEDEGNCFEDDPVTPGPRRDRDSVVTFAIDTVNNARRRESVDSGISLTNTTRYGARGSTYDRSTRGGCVQFHHYLAPPGDNDTKDAESKGPAYLEAITLPQSTHTLLFTEPINSLPFGFAFIILVVSITCLALAFADNFDGSTSQNPFKVPGVYVLCVGFPAFA